jgi:hypothetical protein
VHHQRCGHRRECGCGRRRDRDGGGRC